MTYRDPSIDNSHGKTNTRSRKGRPIAVARPWPGGGDIDQQEEAGPRLSEVQLHSLSRKGLWSMLLFLLVSIAAFLAQDFRLYETLPEAVLQILGCPPPAFLTHLAITGYSFTVIVPVLIRMATGANPTVGWHHLGCRSVFYLFYLVSNSLPQNFIAVITLGVLLYLLEQLGIWAYLHKYIRRAGATN